MNFPFSRLIIEEEAAGDPLTLRMAGRLPETPVEVTGNPAGTLKENSGKRDFILLMRRRGAFVKDFPVPPDSPPCGEKYLVTMLNCPFSCTYCYLQSYLDHGSIVIFTNTDRLKAEVKETLDGVRPRRLTTGELGDSLALDHLTGITAEILDILTGTDTILDVRTKSDCVDHLLAGGTTSPSDDEGINPREEDARGNPAAVSRDNLVITWTLGPQEGIRREENGTASLRERFDAMRRVSKAGIMVGIRFDPIIPYYADIAEYARLVERIAEAVDRDSIHRFELGILRFPPGLMSIVRRKNPGSVLLRGEYIRGRDGKYRLYRPKRVGLYREIYGSILHHFPDATVELSMEDRSVWEDCGIMPPKPD